MLLSVSKEQSLTDLLPKILRIKFETVVRKCSGHLGEGEYGGRGETEVAPC